MPDSILGQGPLNIDELFDQPIPPIPWAVEGLIAEQDFCLLSGQAYIGKTYLLMDLAIQLALGGHWLRHFPITRSYGVVYLDREMSDWELSRRFKRMFQGMPADTERPENLYIFPYSRFRMDNLEHVRTLVEFIKERKVEFVVADSLRKLIAGDENDSRVASAFHDAWYRIKGETNAGLVATAHWNKDMGLSAEEDKRGVGMRLRGSAAWRDMSDAHIGVRKGDKQHFLYVHPDKTRPGTQHKAFMARFMHTEPTDLDNTPVYIQVANLRDPKQWEDAKCKLYKYIVDKSGGVTKKALADAISLSERMVELHLADLMMEKKVVCVVKGGGRGHPNIYGAAGSTAPK